MTPTKLLIAQRLEEVARELESIIDLASDLKTNPWWYGHVTELANAADLAKYLAADIRSDP